MFLLLFIVITSGVFDVDGDEVKSVMEGDSVTLHTDITQIHTGELIMWMFAPHNTLIAQIYEKNIDIFDTNKIFGDRLKLDSQTGSLTIKNITITNSGLYKLKISSSRGTSNKRFNVIVYAPLPIPVITRDSSQCSSSSSSSSSKCLLLCSVLNVRDVSLSWYKGNSLLSNISVSDLNIRLSLPLEVEYQDNNTYSCVLNNPITNQTQHLNINDVCQPCSELRIVVGSLVVVLLVAAVVIGVICCCYKKKIKQEKEAQVPPVDTQLPLI